MRKGQMFTSDLVTSLVIFLTVMNLGFFAIQQSVTGQSQFNEQKRMAQQAYQTGDLLVRTPGYPSDWNRSTVRVVGLASEGQILNNTKLSELRLIDGYTAQREAMGVLPSELFINVTRNGSTVEVPGQNGAGGLGDGAVAVIVESGSENINDHAFIRAINNSDMTWDLYWPSTEEGGLDALTARTVYDHTTDAAAMADDLFRNLSDAGYRTVLAEDVGVTVDQVLEEDRLSTFIEEGGTIVHAGTDPVFIRELFDLGATSDGDESAYVRRETALLNDSLAVGETFEFSGSPMAFAETDAVYVNGTEDPNCLVCRWDIGAGQVFYVADTHTSDDGPTVFQDGAAAFSGAMRLVFGSPVPDDAAQIAVSRRSVIVDSVDGLQRARVRVILWR